MVFNGEILRQGVNMSVHIICFKNVRHKLLTIQTAIFVHKTVHIRHCAEINKLAYKITVIVFYNIGKLIGENGFYKIVGTFDRRIKLAEIFVVAFVELRYFFAAVSSAYVPYIYGFPVLRVVIETARVKAQVV